MFYSYMDFHNWPIYANLTLMCGSTILEHLAIDGGLASLVRYVVEMPLVWYRKCFYKFTMLIYEYFSTNVI